jgi:hypothetical protein
MSMKDATAVEELSAAVDVVAFDVVVVGADAEGIAFLGSASFPFSCDVVDFGGKGNAVAIAEVEREARALFVGCDIAVMGVRGTI